MVGMLIKERGRLYPLKKNTVYLFLFACEKNIYMANGKVTALLLQTSICEDQEMTTYRPLPLPDV